MPDFSAGTVSVVDLPAQRQIADVAVGSEPDSVAITPAGRIAVVANYGSASVSMIDTGRREVPSEN